MFDPLCFQILHALPKNTLPHKNYKSKEKDEDKRNMKIYNLSFVLIHLKKKGWESEKKY